MRFAWPSSNGRTGLDDIELVGTLSFTPVQEDAPGVFLSSSTSCAVGSVDVTCSVATPALAGTETLVFP